MSGAAIAPVSPRDPGLAFMYRGFARVPQACIVEERFDDIPKCMWDANVLFPDETRLSVFDFDLHALDCPGGVDFKSKCPCGARPADANHKFKRLLHTKAVIMNQTAQDSGEIAGRVRDDNVIEVTSGKEHPHVPMSYDDAEQPVKETPREPGKSGRRKSA